MRGIDFNNNWKFKLDNQFGMHLEEYDDSDFKNVTIPHDWSTEKEFDKENGQACTGFLTGGIGWYRKKFKTTSEMVDKDVLIDFDGIYNRSTIYCNGEMITFHPFGYSPCLVDITKYLKAEGEENIIAVNVDHSRYADSRWYTGSGIYRKVALIMLPKLHIKTWGTFFTTPYVNEEKAVVNGTITLENHTIKDELIDLKVNVYNPENELVNEFSKSILVYANDINREIDIDFEIENPILWDVYKGNQYKINLQVVSKGNVVQEDDTFIGIRTIKFDSDKGFFLNGKSMKIKGVCLHHDAGAVGAAVALDVWKTRLQKLIDCGCNAIRTAHNPASEDFLDLCDKMGLLVQEEFYDEWDNPKDKRYNGTQQQDKVSYITTGHAEFFQEYAKSDLQVSMLRDRNHPCIFQWSIGNEIEWTYPKYNYATGYFGADASGNYFWTAPPFTKEKIRENVSKLQKEHYEVGETAHKLAKWTKEMDKTRPVVANCILPSASYESGYTDALDVVGYSYRQVVYDYGHTNYPDKPIMGTENVAQWHEWKAVTDREFISGMFIWTGVDYIGEGGGDNPWPKKGTPSGMLDYCGFEKPSYHMYKTLWNDAPHIHLETQTEEKSLYKVTDNNIIEEKIKDGWKQRLWYWHDVNPYWNYKENEMIIVEAYTNCEEAELYLNNVSLGKKALKENPDHILKWAVPYADGDLKIVGFNNGQEETSDIIKTAKEFSNILLTPDKDIITTSIDEASQIEMKITDKDGNIVTYENHELTVEITGPCRIHSIDNGSELNVSAYQGYSVNTYKGKALLTIQGKEKGNIEIVVKSEDIVSDKLIVKVI